MRTAFKVLGVLLLAGATWTRAQVTDRTQTPQEVALRHGGEAQASRDRFVALPESARKDLLDFLECLVLFPPDDTASNLNPGNRAAPDFPQRGHGSIALIVLFDDPTDPE